MKKGTIGNVIYVLRRTLRYEPIIIIILCLQVAIGVIIPFITVYLPSVVLAGVTGGLEWKSLIFRTFGLILVLGICNLINAYITSVYETYLLNNKIHFLTDLFQRKMELSYAFIESADGQNMYQYAMGTLLNDNQGITGMLRMLGALLGNICSIVLYAGFISNLNLLLVLVLLGTSMVHFLILQSLLKKEHGDKEFLTDTDRKMNYLYEYVSRSENNKDIKIFSMKTWLKGLLDSLITRKMVWTEKMERYQLFASLSDILLLLVRDGLAYFFIFYAILHHEIEISQFIFYFGIIAGFSAFVTELTGNLAYLNQRSREVDGYRGYFTVENDDGANMEIDMKADEGLEIELIDVSWRVKEDDPYILDKVNLHIGNGEKIALVGANGAGKTTLVKLMCGLYRPTEGKVLINGIDLNDLSQSCRSRMFAAVFQDIYVLPMSVAENIAFGDWENKEKEIYECLKIAGLDGMIKDIHLSVTKELDKDGIVFSGGQEQRLILARAVFKILYGQAIGLLLDEPTSALDPLAEREFYETYNALSKGLTSVFISHRLASTQFCDRIIFLDSGKIAESGTHAGLLLKNGKYRELYDIQSRYYK